MNLDDILRYMCIYRESGSTKNELCIYVLYGFYQW